MKNMAIGARLTLGFALILLLLLAISPLGVDCIQRIEDNLETIVHENNVWPGRCAAR